MGKLLEAKIVQYDQRTVFAAYGGGNGSGCQGSCGGGCGSTTGGGGPCGANK